MVQHTIAARGRSTILIRRNITKSDKSSYKQQRRENRSHECRPATNHVLTENLPVAGQAAIV